MIYVFLLLFLPLEKLTMKKLQFGIPASSNLKLRSRSLTLNLSSPNPNLRKTSRWEAFSKA